MEILLWHDDNALESYFHIKIVYGFKKFYVSLTLPVLRREILKDSHDGQ